MTSIKCPIGMIRSIVHEDGKLGTNFTVEREGFVFAEIDGDDLIIILGEKYLESVGQKKGPWIVDRYVFGRYQHIFYYPDGSVASIET